jgi:REP element-mobilizing transposase RayT
MGRQLRPALPGTTFHITARTQWQEPLLRGAESQIASLIRSSTSASDARLLAYAVMSNHIHVVLVQGRRPLAAYMQPLLRRIALLVNRQRSGGGHVFAGRYHHTVCMDPDYFRSIIAYVHLNPVRAGVCARPERYEWSSHAAYAVRAGEPSNSSFGMDVDDALGVFASTSSQSVEACRRDYRRYVRWRLAMDRYLADDCQSTVPLPRAPRLTGGDGHWHRQFATSNALRLTRPAWPPARLDDLRDHIRGVLETVAPDMSLEQLRAGGCARPLVRVRRQVIARSLIAGYPAMKVAAFLNVSPSAVSGVRAMLRAGAA